MSDARSAPTTPRRTTRKRRDIRERMERAVLDHWELLDDEDIAIFTIRRPDGSDFAEFEAGQYTMLAFWDQPTDDPRPRQLSIGSTPLDLDHLEFYVILVRDARGRRVQHSRRVHGHALAAQAGRRDSLYAAAGRSLHAVPAPASPTLCAWPLEQAWRRSSRWHERSGTGTRKPAGWTGG